MAKQFVYGKIGGNMKLEKLLSSVNAVSVRGNLDIEIDNIVFDSNKVNKNSLFVCLNGGRCDGHCFAQLAIANGAVAVVCQKDIFSTCATIVRVKDTRQTLSLIASEFYGNPAKKLNIISVVGTNGKSSTAYITSKLLNDSGKNCGLIGTMYYEYNGKKIPSDLTTPDPLQLHELLRNMLDDGVKYVVMEVSAHAIYHKKLSGIKSDMTIFTNLSQDHLDFFGNMDRYKECKKSFFTNNYTKLAIVNSDDECGREILTQTKLPTISYGLQNPSDAFAIDVNCSIKGCNYVVNILDEIFEVDTCLLGEFNVYNALAACVAAINYGISTESIRQSLKHITPPVGRFNAVSNRDITYIVDFAHTPDGLYNLLKEARKICQGRLITIFGCGGDRDVKKRPIMGKIASEMSDIVIVTTDNPRTENRKAIVGDILSGIRLKGKLYVELDRAKAIKLGNELAVQGDMVLIAGKGSENYIDENNSKIPFNDMTQVLCCLEEDNFAG